MRQVWMVEHRTGSSDWCPDGIGVRTRRAARARVSGYIKNAGHLRTELRVRKYVPAPERGKE